MGISCTFDGSLKLFRHHFSGDPILPGAMVLDYYVACDRRREPMDVVRISNVRFQRYIRPDSNVEFSSFAEGRVEARVAGNLCCIFEVGQPRLGRERPIQPSIGREMASVRVSPLRDPAYWFLRDTIEVDAQREWAICEIDLEQLDQKYAWLYELDRWQTLFLIESAGNLALTLQHMRSPSTVSLRYVLVRFDEINYLFGCTRWSTRQTVVTYVRRSGRLLVWDAWVLNGNSITIAIRGAVSHGEILQ